jgi:integrase
MGMKLTKRYIDSVSYSGMAGRRDVRWDALLPGFGIRIYPNGKKAYVLSYRAGGRKRLITLGSASVLTLEQARDMAREHLVKIVGGNDPLEQRRKLAQGETVKDLCFAYLEHHAKVHKKSWKEDERRIGRYLVPIWSNHKVANIKRADVVLLHRKIGEKHPYEANRVLELVSKIFSLARRWGFVDDASINPAKDIDHYKEHKRDRWVTHEELPRLMQAIGQDPNYYARAALWLYLLTGMRKSELLKARWQDVNWERRELRLPDTKAGRVHYVPLSEAAISLLNKLQRVDGNPYILPGHAEGKHLVNIDKPWQRVRKAAGIEDVRLHDLRRTVGSWLAQAGNSLHLIGRVLNHSNPATTAVYARFGQDQVRQALEDHSKRILGISGLLPTAEVVNLKE